MFDYRNLNQDDFAIISTFPQSEQELFYMFPKGKYPLTPDQLQETAKYRCSPTVITFNNEIAGYSNLYDVQEGQDCWIGNVIINPKHRRIGAGTFLIKTMMRRASEEHRVKELKLVCHNTNTRALLFYYKLGFRPFDMKIMQDPNNNDIAGIKMSVRIE
jgi:ribosomal protein S18 acetylase RimI-like enzyme